MRTTPFSVEKVKIPTAFAEFGDTKKPYLDLAGCENSETSQKAIDAIKNCTPNMLIEHWQSQDKTIRKELAAIHDVSAQNVFLTSGAMGAIGYVFDVFVDRSTHVGLLCPDFSGFKYYAAKAKANVSWLESFQFPYVHHANQIIDFVKKQNIGFLITSNPSAVTGTMRTKTQIEDIISANPETMHVIDEADSIYPSSSSAYLTRQHNNVLHLGSFSKFYGLSGLRIGYLITPEKYTNHFDRMINPVEITSTAILAAQHALADKNYQKKTQKRVANNLNILLRACEGSEYRLVPGSNCFATYIDSNNRKNNDPFEMLLKQGINIAQGSTFGLPRGGRINLANEEAIKQLVSVISLHK